MFHFIQHVDINAKPSDYKHLKENELLITSIFYTIQGEGPLSGQTCTFVRLAGCNYGGKNTLTNNEKNTDINYAAGCEFCDTFFKYSEGKIKTFDQILEEVKIKSENKSNLIIISGGEPMLQGNVIAFVQFLNINGYRTQFETNGVFYRNIPNTYYHEETKQTLINTIVCSPKMGASYKYGELRPDVFDRADCLKFVVEKEGRFTYIPKYAYEFAKTGKPVYISPINVYKREVARGEIPCFFTEGLFDIKICAENYKFAAELCLETGFILNLQKHLFLFLE